MIENSDELVSVVIPVHNRAKYLAVAIESVLAQTVSPFEIIVVDDGSTDDISSVVNNYGDRIRYFWQQNQGPSAARNFGIKESRGNLIAFLDSDDVWLPEKLAKQIDQFRKNESLGLIATLSYICDENLENQSVSSCPRMAPSDREEILIKNIWATPSVLIKKICFETVGLFNEKIRFAEDWDMWMRIAQEFPVRTIEEPLVKIRKHSASLSGASANSLYNFKIWEELISLNRERFMISLSAYLKSLSWYYLNFSFFYKDSGMRSHERYYLIKSLVSWPFFLPRRVLALLRTFIIK